MPRSLTARRTLAAVALAPLLLTGVAACGDDSDGSGQSAKEPAAAAGLLADLQKGDEVDPAKFVDTVADGIEASTTAHLRMKMSAGDELFTEATGAIDYQSTPPAMEMTMTIPGADEAEVVMVDGVVYLQMGGMTGGKYWKIDPSDEDGMMGGLGSMLDQTDPLAGLKAMKPGIDTVTYEGNEEVDGRDLDRYELTIDMKTALKSYGGDLPGGGTGTMPKTVSYDLWLDDEDRFAQMSMEYPVMEQEIAMEMTLDDWGTDVTIEAPPADEITDMPDLGGLMSPAPSA